MEDDYELVSKKLVAALKEENAKLKTQVANAPSNVEPVDNSSLVQEILDAMHEESSKERELILENLSEIKDLNKSTLDNLLTKTEQLDERLEGMVDTIEGLVEHLSSMVESLSGMKDGMKVDSLHENVGSLHQKIDQLGESQKEVESVSVPAIDNSEVISKLNEISIFMENLRVLLSYVKPSNVVIDKPSATGSLGQGELDLNKE